MCINEHTQYNPAQNKLLLPPEVDASAEIWKIAEAEQSEHEEDASWLEAKSLMLRNNDRLGRGISMWWECRQEREVYPEVSE